ncbi:MAG: ribonuclease P protein component [Aureliella sp.]
MQRDKSTEGARRDASFPASLRIKSGREFQLVFSRGKVAADDVLVMHGIRNLNPSVGTGSGHEEPTRLGISISKKVGSAPKRNRWKRLIREAYRAEKREIPRGLLLVARPRKGAEPDLDLISKAIRQLSRRLDRKLP